jgi:hypothetical protein
MFEQIRSCVEASLAGPERATVDLERFLCLDVSRGRIDGCCCLFFGPEGDEPTVVAKAARSAVRKAIYRLDLENLRILDEAGFNAERRTTPRPLGSVEERGVLVTLQSALPGRLMRNVPAERLFSPEQAGRTIDQVISWSGRLQEAFGVQRRTLDESLYEKEVLSLVRRFRRRYIVGDDETALLERRFEDERRLSGLELPFTVAHGDFCTANLVTRDDGIGAFDWEHRLSHGLPLYDLFFFFSSTRFPFTGLKRESTYRKSFVELFWGDGYLTAALRKQLARSCETLEIPAEAICDLFLLALLVRADRKFDMFLEAGGIADASVPEGVSAAEHRATLWERLRPLERDAPLYWVREGVLESLRHVARHGLPRLSP